MRRLLLAIGHRPRRQRSARATTASTRSARDRQKSSQRRRIKLAAAHHDHLSCSSSQRSITGPKRADGVRSRVEPRRQRLAVAERPGCRTATLPSAHSAVLSSSAISSSGTPGPSESSAIVTGRARRVTGSARLACSWLLSTRVRLSASSGSERSSASKWSLSIFSTSRVAQRADRRAAHRVAEQRELSEHGPARERVEHVRLAAAPAAPPGAPRARRTRRPPARLRGTATRPRAGSRSVRARRSARASPRGGSANTGPCAGTRRRVCGATTARSPIGLGQARQLAAARARSRARRERATPRGESLARARTCVAPVRRSARGTASRRRGSSHPRTATPARSVSNVSAPAIAIRIATPSAAPSCVATEFSEVATANRGPGTESTATPLRVGNARPPPTPRITIPGSQPPRKSGSVPSAKREVGHTGSPHDAPRTSTGRCPTTPRRAGSSASASASAMIGSGVSASPALRIE